ncbi:MAG: Gmad2 immunoglobulin-like domain-containing protein [Bacillota bacterium]
MRKSLAIIAALLMLMAGGCTVSRKPAPPPGPRTIVVPEVSKVPFTTIQINQAPGLVRDLAKFNEKQETATWVRIGNTIYVLVTRGEKTTGGFSVDLQDVLQRVPDDNRRLIEVMVKYTDPAADQQATQVITHPLAVARIKFDGNPDGLSFKFENMKTAEKTPTPTPAQPPVVGGAKTKKPFIRVTQPKLNDTVTSPLQVKGTAAVFEGTVNIQLSDRKGKVLAETIATALGIGGPFTGTLNFASPPEPTKGFLEVFSTSPEDGRVENLVVIPVTIQ